MFNIILILIVVAIGLLLILVARQPSDFRISRSEKMAAPAATIFALINDLKQWDAWSPWAKLDPDATNTFDGPQTGTGAIMRWSGNNKVGVGSMRIIESQPDGFIKFKLEFLKPMTAINTAEFAFNPEGTVTTVTWTMYGTNNFMGKLMGLIMNCDKMVGGQFAQGLASLKKIVEG